MKVTRNRLGGILSVSRRTTEQKRRLVVKVAFVVSFLILLFPPFYYPDFSQRQWHSLLDSRFRVSRGFRGNQEGHLDINMLLLELVLLGVSAGAAYYALGQKSDQ